MRKLTMYCFLLFSIGMFSQEKPQISFQWKTIDLGKIDSSSGNITHVNFIFSNNGKKPLVIYKVRPSCGCTVPQWSKRPIMPGKKGMIKVDFDPKDQKGFFQKEIFVESNSEKDVMLLKIKGNVE